MAVNSSGLENNHTGKLNAGAAKKRPALSNILNHITISSRNLISHSSKLSPGTVVLPASSSVRSSSKPVSTQRSDAVVPKISAIPLPATYISMDESMDTVRSPEVEYIDDHESAAVDSIEKKVCSTLYISEHVKAADICRRDVLVDPQLCNIMAYFMTKVHKDINPSMRAILIDCYNTLLWTIDYIDQYLSALKTAYVFAMIFTHFSLSAFHILVSSNISSISIRKCSKILIWEMLYCTKYEEIYAPQVEEFYHITDNTYFKEEVLQMESVVLNYLKFEMTAPTAKCFLRRFVRADQGLNELEHLASYIAELSLLEYNMLCYAPALIAASAIFLAKYILLPSRKPWNSTLRRYTLYQPSYLQDRVMALHNLFCNTSNSSLPAYKFIAKKCCPPIVLVEFFHNISS
ncbi:hypothetical protein R3W88_014354 [Solanum pinnatisectum]|uniref:B-like cyclin n=1 Tax=Solanum pinnatisectum TaxID=50273 RepID=A0AAV9KRU4_9SOLN|nr:hypothetical protein R3W88_014354 [Solanum pinnatisectum]